MIDLRNAITIRTIPENENPNKILEIVEKILDFKEKQKGKGLPLDFYRTQLKILSPKQMLQRLPIALAQIKTGNTSENLLNEIRQIRYSLYQEKEVTTKVYNNLMNSIKL